MKCIIFLSCCLNRWIIFKAFRYRKYVFRCRKCDFMPCICVINEGRIEFSVLLDDSALCWMINANFSVAFVNDRDYIVRLSVKWLASLFDFAFFLSEMLHPSVSISFRRDEAAAIRAELCLERNNYDKSPFSCVRRLLILLYKEFTIATYIYIISMCSFCHF